MSLQTKIRSNSGLLQWTNRNAMSQLNARVSLAKGATSIWDAEWSQLQLQAMPRRQSAWISNRAGLKGCVSYNVYSTCFNYKCTVQKWPDQIDAYALYQTNRLGPKTGP
jgi:hypothetical protein